MHNTNLILIFEGDGDSKRAPKTRRRDGGGSEKNRGTSDPAEQGRPTKTNHQAITTEKAADPEPNSIAIFTACIAVSTPLTEVVLFGVKQATKNYWAAGCCRTVV